MKSDVEAAARRAIDAINDRPFEHELRSFWTRPLCDMTLCSSSPTARERAQDPTLSR